ncbi:NAD+ synthase [Raphidocelis subcapitata]|uniref:NAD+ synthase n=1 Tax=Raphidocelis subcapitata TaxID=307507 RepID=A0A2V0PCP1_9CHLO|nr:NAD+ synthase [Raphidocelis subcapitata]|eukprot:GBF95673.1 NAD+ synthase [Raphidocelis subcapitata]
MRAAVLRSAADRCARPAAWGPGLRGPGNPTAAPALPARPQQLRAARVVALATPKRNSDGEPPAEATRFEVDTTDVVIRCLTARAVQKLILNLESLGDGQSFTARWLNDFCAHHPPLRGDEFIAELMHTQPVALVDPYSGRTHIISPTQLATGVLTVREELSRHVAKSLPGAVAAGNVAVLRRHLETHTYVSGTNAAPRASYRHYRRPRARGSRWSQMSSS